MASIPSVPKSDSHWYDAQGRPVHRQPLAKGDGDRPTTLRDARKLGLFPSVTGILGVLGKPGLQDWKIKQAIKAAELNPRQEAEADDRWFDRVQDAAFAQVEQAANLGTRIHAALEAATLGEPYADDLAPYIGPLVDWHQQRKFTIVEREKCLVNHDHGFAGTADVLFRIGASGIGIIDYKTRKTITGQKCEPYDGQGMQLAAYGASYFGEAEVCHLRSANIYISTTEPGRFEVFEHKDPVTDWRMFKRCCALWRYLHAYDPRTM